ncbi:MAG: hypothetical protein Q8Q60_01060 [Candidatus Chromulinivorax sp.]|nr:hypothetical protein [Candidatus Chromulinivorax sp.]
MKNKLWAIVFLELLVVSSCFAMQKLNSPEDLKLQAELAQLQQENVRLKVQKEIVALKKENTLLQKGLVNLDANSSGFVRIPKKEESDNIQVTLPTSVQTMDNDRTHKTAQVQSLSQAHPSSSEGLAARQSSCLDSCVSCIDVEQCVSCCCLCPPCAICFFYILFGGSTG